jgi:two-component system cell cycle sensor histidine kinase/response regulator CckA
LLEVDESFTRAHQPMTPGRYVEMQVVDTGHGMSSEKLTHILEPFFTTKETGKGTGLGLAMVYGTVQQSGGFIFVDSAIGKGTTFRVYFPPTQEDIPGSPAPADGAHEIGSNTILVVEDESSVRELVVSTLKRNGYRVLHAASGEDALAAANEAGYNIALLLTDANMPGMDGIAVARAMRARQPQLPVIVMSGYMEASHGRDVPHTLLSKPFTPKDLIKKVRDILGAAKGTAADDAPA